MSLGLSTPLIFVFLVIGSVFSGTESVLVSLRGSQIEQMEQEDARGTKVARITRNPDTSLSTVQIGVALYGLLSASFGVSLISPHLIPVMEGWDVPTGITGGLVNIALTLIISYCSIMTSEMISRRIAIQRTEQIVRTVIPAADVFTMICRPAIWLVGKNTSSIVRVLGFDPQQTESEVSDDKLRVLVGPNTNLSKDERAILDDMFGAPKTIVAEVIRPRVDVVFTETDQPLAEVAAFVHDQPHSRYPVTGKDFDDVTDFAYVRDSLGVCDPKAKTAYNVVREGIPLPGASKLLPSLELPRKRDIHLAVVIDEHGGADNIVTLGDMTEELMGDIRDEYGLPSEKGGGRTTCIAFVNGIATIEASMTVEDFADLTGTKLEDGPYETAADYFLSKAGKMGMVSDVLHSDDGYNIVITKVDGCRVETIEVRKTGAPDHTLLPTESQSGDANQPRDTHHLSVWPGAQPKIAESYGQVPPAERRSIMTLAFAVPSLDKTASEKTIAILQNRLSQEQEATLVLKHIRWNVTDPNFIAVYRMLNPEVEAMLTQVDEAAERVVTLGDIPNGRADAIVCNRTQKSFDVEGRVGTEEYLKALIEYYDVFIADDRKAIAELDKLDVISSNIIRDHVQELEKFQ